MHLSVVESFIRQFTFNVVLFLQTELVDYHIRKIDLAVEALKGIIGREEALPTNLYLGNNIQINGGLANYYLNYFILMLGHLNNCICMFGCIA